MTDVVEGRLNATGMRFGIVVAKFNEFVTDRLLSSALKAIEQYGGANSDIQIAHVPGGFEIPLVCKAMALTGKFDAVIALGAVIRGSTAHFDYICDACTTGITQAMLETNVPIAYGVLTVDTYEQAMERADKGEEVAIAAIEMVDILRQVNADG